MDLIDRIDEATKKPSFVQYFFAKKNYNKLKKEFDDFHLELATEYGNDILDSEYEYDEEEYGDYGGYEVSPDEAYDNYAHTMGYSAEYDAAREVIENHKNKYDYKRGDETDSNHHIYGFIDYMGYSTDFGSYGRKRKNKQDYWKMAEQEVWHGFIWI